MTLLVVGWLLRGCLRRMSMSVCVVTDGPDNGNGNTTADVSHSLPRLLACSPVRLSSVVCESGVNEGPLVGLSSYTCTDAAAAE